MSSIAVPTVTKCWEGSTECRGTGEKTPGHWGVRLSAMQETLSVVIYEDLNNNITMGLKIFLCMLDYL